MNNLSGTENVITKTVHTALLLDAYGQLLSERQRECLSLFYEEDLSLSEIGDKFSISRQAVHDAIRHGEAQLNAYENALHLLERSNKRQETIEILREKIGADKEIGELLDGLL